MKRKPSLRKDSGIESLNKSISLSLPDFSHFKTISFVKMEPKLCEESEIDSSQRAIFKTDVPLNKAKSSRRESVLQKIKNTLSMNSGLMSSLVLRNGSTLQKVGIFISKVLLTHTLAFSLTLLKIGVQSWVDNYCWVISVCECGESMKIKLYSSLCEFVTCWTFYAIIIVKSTSLFKEFRILKQKQWLQSMNIFCDIIGVITYGFVVDEKNYNSVDIYLILVIFPVGQAIYFLFHDKKHLFMQMKKLSKSCGLIFFIFLNYLTIRFVLISSKGIVAEYLSPFWAKNVLLLLNALYFNFFFWGMKKLLFMYYDLAVSETKDYNSGITLMRFSLGFGYSLNFAGLLKMQPEDLGGWVLLTLYAIYVLQIYADFNFPSMILSKIKNLLKIPTHKKKTISEEKLEQKAYFEKLYAGCMFDFQIIAILRIVAWVFLKHWFSLSFDPSLNLNCKFEISTQNFLSNDFGISTLFATNLLIILSVFFYMIKSQKILFEYKEIKNFWYNLYFLFLAHGFFESCVQVSFLIS